MILILEIKRLVYQFIIRNGCKAKERIYLLKFNVEVIMLFNGSWTNYRRYQAIITMFWLRFSDQRHADIIVQANWKALHETTM